VTEFTPFFPSHWAGRVEDAFCSFRPLVEWCCVERRGARCCYRGCPNARWLCQHRRRVPADIEGKRSSCRSQTFRTNVEKARCHNAAEARLGEVWGMDLAAVRWQSRLVIAEKTDRKQLTEAELEFAKVNADLTLQATRRRQAQQLVEAQYEAVLAQRRSQRAMQS
jgi:hypothetical protein